MIKKKSKKKTLQLSLDLLDQEHLKALRDRTGKSDKEILKLALAMFHEKLLAPVSIITASPVPNPLKDLLNPVVPTIIPYQPPFQPYLPGPGIIPNYPPFHPYEITCETPKERTVSFEGMLGTGISLMMECGPPQNQGVSGLHFQ